MLISEKHKFIFVHIPKTAGTTIVDVLCPYSEKRPPMPLFRRLLSNIPIRENYDKALIRAHYSARWTRLKFGRRFYDEKFTFAFVRNPYDLLVSRYLFIKNAQWHHRNQDVQTMSFNDFLKWEASRHRFRHKDQMSFITDYRGNVIIDEVYRFENLAEGMNNACGKIGIPAPEKLGWKKKQEREHYSAYYKDNDIELASKIYKRDLDAFNYEFKRL